MLLEKSIVFIDEHPRAKTVAERRRLFAEISIVLAREPDGFAIARRVAMDLADFKLDLGIRTLFRLLFKRICERIVSIYRSLRQ